MWGYSLEYHPSHSQLHCIRQVNSLIFKIPETPTQKSLNNKEFGMSAQIGKIRLATASGLSAGIMALSIGTAVSASETPKAPGNTETSAMIHFPGAIRDSVNEKIIEKFTERTGHSIHSEYQRSGGFSNAIKAGTEEGKPRFNLVMTYGRTGETPPGRDVFKHMNNARDLFQPLPGHFEMVPEFANLADTGDGQLLVPYVGMMAITYNPELIDTADVPKSWAELAEFDGTLAVPGRGCFAMRTLASLYDIVGAEKFETIIKTAKMPAMETMKDDARKGGDRPLSGCGAAEEVLKGNHQVAIGPIVGPNIIGALNDGTLAVIWPAEGAVAFPYLMAVKKDPSKVDMALLDFVAKDEAMQQMFVDYGISSTLAGGKVTGLIKENGFNFRFVPMENKMNPEVHQDIIAIVERNKPD